MVNYQSVLVVGGGIGGMACSLALHGAGYSVDIVDIDPGWRAVGAGLTLNGGALRAFHRLGLLDKVKAAGYCATGPTLIMDADGELISSGPASSVFGQDIPVLGGILRPRLHDVMRKEVLEADIRVRLGVTVSDFKEQTGGVGVTTTDGETASYDFVIGADGLMSKVRSMILPDAPAPRFTGQGCWRAVVRRPSDVTSTVVYSAPFIKAGFNPISEEQMYVYVLESMPDNHWICEDEWLPKMRARLEQFHGHFDAIRGELNEGSSINYRPLESLFVTNSWYRGRVLLIGDAAHATTPHVGYGAGLAIEDAVVIGELAARGLKPPELFERFMDRRYERCRFIVSGSLSLGDLEIAGAPPHESRRLITEIAKVIQQEI